MAESPAEKIAQKIPQAAQLYHRLLLLVAPSGAGKTEALTQFHELTDTPLINVNLQLSQRMIDLTERQRALQVPEILSNIVSVPLDVVLLDNIELLFDVTLKQDPMRLLQRLSRNKTIVASWGGIVDDGHILYATPGHPEYRRYAMREAMVMNWDSAA